MNHYNNGNERLATEVANKFKDFIIQTYGIKNDTVTKLEKSMVKQLYMKRFSTESRTVDFMQIMTNLKVIQKSCDEINGYILWGDPERIVEYLFKNDVQCVKHANYFLARFQHFCHSCNMGFENGRGWKQHLSSKKHQINQFKCIIMKFERKDLVKDKPEVRITSEPLCDTDGTIRTTVETNNSIIIPIYIKIEDPSFSVYSFMPLYDNKNFEYDSNGQKEEGGFIKHNFKVKEQTQFGHQFYPIAFKFDSIFQTARSIFIMRIIEVNTVGKLYTKLVPTEAYRKKEIVQVPANVTTIAGIPLPDIQNSQLKIEQLRQDDYKIPSDIRTFLQSASKVAMDSFEAKLKEKVTTANYFHIFTRLLSLEEHQLDLDIRFYDMKDAKFKDVKRKVYLHLTAPSVVDNRPAVIVGDVLYVYEDKSRTRRYEAIVHEIIDGCVLKLGIDDRFPFVKNKAYDIEFSYNKSVFSLMHKALGKYFENQSLFEGILFPAENPSTSTRLARPLHDITINTWYDRNLNEEQKTAVVNIVNNTSKSAPFIIFGPPGTGKTVTLVETIKQVYNSSTTNRIIACSSSNLATDLLAQRLCQHVDKSAILRLYNRTITFGQVPTDLINMSNFDRIKREVYFPTAEKLQNYRIIVCSLVTYGRLLMLSDYNSQHVSHLFIDEAAQSLEPELLIPIVDLVARNSSCKIVLAGDPRQLGPIIHSPLAKQYNLQQSMLERLISQNNAYCLNGKYDERMCVKLVNNYRSHHTIIEVPKQLFYDGILNECAGDIRNLFVNTKWDLLPNKKFPCIFHPVYGKEEQEGDSPSYFNLAEIETIDLYLTQLLDDQIRDKKLKFLKPSQIGIISPYRGQLQKIKKVIAEKKYGADLKVGSVEEFQGQERCVIIISSVRSFNSFSSKERKLQIGFLNNPKRFNVAITRAQALVIVVGNPFMLKADENWEKYLKYLKENKAWSNVSASSLNTHSQNEYQELTNLFDQIKLKDSSSNNILKFKGDNDDTISATTLKEHLEWPKYD